MYTFIYLIVSRLNGVEEIADVDWFQKGNFCKEESTSIESGERIQGANCTELLQTGRMAEGPISSQTLTLLSSLLLIQISYCWKCAITLVTLENLPLFRLNEWQKDPPTTLRRLYATWNWKSAHWKPLADFRETFCIVSSTQFAATKARRLKVI